MIATWVLAVVICAFTIGVGVGYAYRELVEWNERKEAALRGTAGPEYSAPPYPHHVVEFPAGRKGGA